MQTNKEWTASQQSCHSHKEVCSSLAHSGPPRWSGPSPGGRARNSWFFTHKQTDKTDREIIRSSSLNKQRQYLDTETCLFFT